MEIKKTTRIEFNKYEFSNFVEICDYLLTEKIDIKDFLKFIDEELYQEKGFNYDYGRIVDYTDKISVVINEY